MHPPNLLKSAEVSPFGQANFGLESTLQAYRSVPISSKIKGNVKYTCSDKDLLTKARSGI